MFDYGLSVMEQYPVTVRDSFRGRGALIIRAQEGLFILRPFSGSLRRLMMQQELLRTLEEIHGFQVDAILSNLEGQPVSLDGDENPYVLRRWYEGRECDTKSTEDILRSAEGLGKLHRVMKLPPAKEYAEEPLDQEYMRRNREIRKIRKFIRKKKVSNTFEREYLRSVEEFLAWGEEALEALGNTEYEILHRGALEEGLVCHGEFNQHHVLLEGDTESYTGFDKWRFGVQSADLYCFMRKILEKCNWNPGMGRRILKAYQNARPLTGAEYENLKLRFTYPEKYWKLANYYYSHNKAWISEKNIQKLQMLIAQKKTWREFAKKCFDATD